MTRLSRRRYLGGSAATVGGLLAAACAAPEPGGQAGGQPAKLTGRLEVWLGSRFDWNDPVPQRIFNDFKTHYPNVSVDVAVDAKEQDGSIEKFTAAVVGGSAPDFAHVPQTYVKDYADKGWLAALDPYFKNSKILNTAELFDAYQRDCQWQGKAFGVTFAGDLRVLYNNTRVWQSAGLDVTRPPKTWAEWDGVIGKLLVKSQSGDIQRLGYNPAGQLTQGFMWAFWQLGGEMASEDATKITLGNGEAAVKAFEWMLRVLNAQGGRDAVGKFHVANGSNPQTPNAADYNTLFINGNVGTMMQTFSNRNEILRKNAPTLEFGWMDVPIPAGGKHANYGGGHAFAIPALGKNKDAGWAFLEHFSANEQNTAFATRFDRVPMRKTVANSPAFLRNDPFLKDMVAFIPSRKFVLVAPYTSAIGGFYGQFINGVLDGRMSAKDAVAEWARLLQAEADKWVAAKKR
jgi:ABC-type glycerol-3-phosphate transport system substrate-binding protein